MGILPVPFVMLGSKTLKPTVAIWMIGHITNCGKPVYQEYQMVNPQLNIAPPLHLKKLQHLYEVSKQLLE